MSETPPDVPDVPDGPDLPDLPDYCWPVDHALCATWEDLDPAVQARADAAAVAALRMLTGYQVGGCPITVYPCAPRPTAKTYTTAPVSGAGWSPYLLEGRWYNLVCGLPACGCGTGLGLHLPGPVGEVKEVMVDGVALDSAAYRLFGTTLIRLDGQVWPAQDIADPEAFAVTYLHGYPVDGLGAYAAGVLACEMAAAMTGEVCALPAGVTSMIRQGVSYEFATGAFPGGLTGLPQVDQFIHSYNPAALSGPSLVWSPDMPQVLR